MGFIGLIGTTYLKKVHAGKNISLVHKTAEIWFFGVQIASY